MQKLWIVSELFPPDETSTSYILGEIAKAMSSKYEVNVICGPEIYDKRKSISNYNLPDDIQVLRVNGVFFDKNTFMGKALSFILMSWRIYKTAKHCISSEDIVLMVTNPAPLVLLLAKLKRKRKFRLSILVHDIFPENTVAAGINLPHIMLNFIKRRFDRAYSCADQLISIGRDMSDVLSRKIESYSNNTDIHIIENWADTESILPQPFPKGKIILQYAGNIGRVQGLDKVIEALPEDIEFHLYGTGAMENTLKELKKNNVFFHGSYKRSEQINILNYCDIALVTLQENMYGLGVPSKTYNILASGRPILFLGPRNSEIDLLIRENGIGYTSWPERWNRDELKEMGQKARVLAEQHYSKQSILQKFVDIL